MTDKDYVFKEMTKIIEILEGVRDYLPSSDADEEIYLEKFHIRDLRDEFDEQYTEPIEIEEWCHLNKVPQGKYQKLLDYLVSKMKTGNADVYFSETNVIDEPIPKEDDRYKLNKLTLVIEHHEKSSPHDWAWSWYACRIYSF